MSDKIEPLPAGCGYTGFEYGAGYIDSECYGGDLFDLDDCDDNGNLYYKDDVPCPRCHPIWYANHYGYNPSDRVMCIIDAMAYRLTGKVIFHRRKKNQ